MATRFDKSNEWGGYSIEPGATGFVLDYHSHNADEPNDLKILIPYGAWGFYRETDLEEVYDETPKGEKLANLAMEDAEGRFENRTVKVLAKGSLHH